MTVFRINQDTMVQGRFFRGFRNAQQGQAGPPALHQGKALAAAPVILLLLLLMLPLLAVSTEITPSFESRIMVFVDRMVKLENIKGLSIGIAGPGGSRWATGFGYADVEQQARASQYTLYPVASLTKILTSAAVMDLAGQGRIGLDDPLTDYLPDFSIHSRYRDDSPIRIRHLLNHYSGLPRDLYKGLLTIDPAQRPDLLTHLSSQYVAYPPEVKYVYSNLGYELLGLVIESVTGMDYPAYVQQQLLGPLGMADSGFFAHQEDIPGLALPYIREFDHPQSEFPSMLTSSGGFFSTAHDMLGLLDWVLKVGQTAPRVPAELVRSMLTDQKTEKALDESFQSGWSWILEDHPSPMKGQYAYQIGNTMHYNAVMAVVPEHRMGVVLICNTGGVMETLEEMARMILMTAIQEQTGKVFPVPLPPAWPPLVEPAREDIERIRGQYLMQTDLLRVYPLEGHAVVTTGGQTLQTAYHADGWFSLGERYRINVSRLEDQKVLMVDQGGYVYPAGIDVSGRYHLPPDVFSMLGTYELTDVDTRIEDVIYERAILQLQEGLLQIRLVLSPHQQHIFGYDFSQYNLLPKSEGQAVIGGFGMYRGETVFFEEDARTKYLRFAGLRFGMPYP